MIADASQMSYISTISCLLCPRRGFAPERQSVSKDMLFLHSEKSHREDFTHRSLYTERDLHRAAFTQTLLHTDAFPYRSFYTQKLLLREAFKQSSFYTYRSCYTKKILHREAFSQTSVCGKEL